MCAIWPLQCNGPLAPSVAERPAGQGRGNAGRGASERRNLDLLGEPELSCRSPCCRRRCGTHCRQQAYAVHLVVVLDVGGCCGVEICDGHAHCIRIGRAVALVQDGRQRQITCTLLLQPMLRTAGPFVAASRRLLLRHGTTMYASRRSTSRARGPEATSKPRTAARTGPLRCAPCATTLDVHTVLTPLVAGRRRSSRWLELRRLQQFYLKGRGGCGVTVYPGGL